jgi:hypothetical protein
VVISFRKELLSMGKLGDFFKRSQSDRMLMSDLDALCFRMQKKTEKNLEMYTSALTEIAKKHGIMLEPGDFVFKTGELDEPELEAVVGGSTGRSSLEELWQDLYDMQPYQNDGTDEKTKKQ